MKLIDPDAMGSVLKKLKGDKYRMINLMDAGSYYYKTDMEEVLTRPHDLAESKPGTGIYILTDDEEVLDEARSWITEVEERGDKYVITKKDYFVLRESNNMPKALRKIVKYLPKVYTDDTPMIYSFKPKNKDTFEGYITERFAFEELKRYGLSLEELNNYFDVYTQRIDHLEKRSLIDALDIPRTVIKKGSTSYKKARKIILTFVYDPLEGIPAFLENGDICELEPVNMTDDGNVIYKLSYKIVSNVSNAEYKERMQRKNNRAVILLGDNLPREIRGILERIYTDMEYDDLLDGSPSKEYVKLCNRLGLEPILNKENILYIFGGEVGLGLIKDSIKELSEYPAGNEKLYIERASNYKTISKMI